MSCTIATSSSFIREPPNDKGAKLARGVITHAQRDIAQFKAADTADRACYCRKM